jgi:tRNA(fMet)-specific endonuclease VapC
LTVERAGQYLLDTNILVLYIRAGDLAKRIEERFALRQSLYKPMISIVSVGEILSLARQFAWGGDKTDIMERLLKDVVQIDISSIEVLRAYAELDHHTRKAGKQIGKNDLWIAATAKATGATLLTMDRDFDCLADALIQRIWIDQKPEA